MLVLPPPVGSVPILRPIRIFTTRGRLSELERLCSRTGQLVKCPCCEGNAYVRDKDGFGAVHAHCGRCGSFTLQLRVR